MKITFVALGSEQLGLSLLSAMAKQKGHEVNLAYSAALFHDRWNLEIPWLAKYFDDRSEVMSTIEKTNPDVLLFSCLTATYRWMLEVASDAKKFNPKIKIVFGGVHVSAVPARVMNNPQIDYAVIGEGEEALMKILERIEEGYSDSPIVNTWFRSQKGELIKGAQKGFNQEIDALPPYDKSLWENHIVVGDRYFTMASRGCPYRCTFCFNNFFAELPDDKKTKGKYVRIRSVDHMMNELIEAKKRYRNIKYIDFQDDVFTTSKAWLKEFLPRYKAEIGLPFQCLTHPKYMDDDIACWMKDAGCMWVQMGVQSMDEDYKTKIKRYERSDHIRSALEVMNKYGLKAKLDHMFGLPGEPIDAQEKALNLYAEFVPARIQTFWTCFLPGTELLREGIAEGIVSEADAERLNDGIDFYFYRNTSNIKNPELVNAYSAYEFIFKIMPLLPKFVRMRIKATHVQWIPGLIRKPVAFIADLITGFAHRNPDFEAYAKHYLFQMYWILMRKIRLRSPKIARLNLKADFEVRIESNNSVVQHVH